MLGVAPGLRPPAYVVAAPRDVCTVVVLLVVAHDFQKSFTTGSCASSWLAAWQIKSGRSICLAFEIEVNAMTEVYWGCWV